MVFGILGMVAFNVADTFFVGQLGSNELAALSFTFPVVLVINSLAQGLGVGASAVISRAIGEGDHHKVQRLTTDSLVLAVLVAIVCVSLGILTIDPLFSLLGATPEVLALIRQYMVIWYFGIIFVVIPMVGNNAIRATGDTKTPSAIMLVAVAINISLDPLLIFGLGPFPRMELSGAALTTVLARATVFFVSLGILYYREKMLTLAWPGFKALFDSWGQVLYIGLPSAGTSMIIPLGTGVITSLIATYGPEAVAAYGVSTRLDMFALTVVMALASVLGPFVGQNWGAGQPERLILGVKYSQGFVTAWGFLVFIGLATAAWPIAGLFNDNPEVISTIVRYLRIVPLGYGLMGLLLLSNTTFNVLNKPLYASALSLTQMFGLYIPLAYAGSRFLGVTGIFIAAATANIVAGLCAYLWLKSILHTKVIVQPAV